MNFRDQSSVKDNSIYLLIPFQSSSFLSLFNPEHPLGMVNFARSPRLVSDFLRVIVILIFADFQEAVGNILMFRTICKLQSWHVIAEIILLEWRFWGTLMMFIACPLTI